jgi:hypothetical protein
VEGCRATLHALGKGCGHSVMACPRVTGEIGA